MTGSIIKKIISSSYLSYVLVGLILVIGVNGCSSDSKIYNPSENNENEFPVLMQTDPLDLAIDIPLNQKIGLTFDNAMDTSTINL